MRRFLLALVLSALTLDAGACSCFSPELRAKTARETLELARLAAFGRVAEVQADGAAKIVVLESFKGPAKDATITVAPSSGQCPARTLAVGEEMFVLSFRDTASVCDRYPQDHFLLEEFRSSAAKGK